LRRIETPLVIDIFFSVISPPRRSSI